MHSKFTQRHQIARVSNFSQKYICWDFSRIIGMSVSRVWVSHKQLRTVVCTPSNFWYTILVSADTRSMHTIQRLIILVSNFLSGFAVCVHQHFTRSLQKLIKIISPKYSFLNTTNALLFLVKILCSTITMNHWTFLIIFWKTHLMLYLLIRHFWLMNVFEKLPRQSNIWWKIKWLFVQVWLLITLFAFLRVINFL